MRSIRTHKVRWSGWVVCFTAIAMLGAKASGEPNYRAVVTGKVVDESGEPVAGVPILADAWRPIEPTVTDADGAFRLSVSIVRGARVDAAPLRAFGRRPFRFASRHVQNCGSRARDNHPETDPIARS